MTDRKTAGERHASAVTDLRDMLVQKGMQPDAARDIAMSAADRILVSSGEHTRVLMPDTRQVYPSTRGNPLRELAAELYAGGSAAVKAGPPEPTEEMLAAKRQQMRGTYL